MSKSGLFNLTILVHKETHMLNFYETHQTLDKFYNYYILIYKIVSNKIDVLHWTTKVRCYLFVTHVKPPRMGLDPCCYYLKNTKLSIRVRCFNFALRLLPSEYLVFVTLVELLGCDPRWLPCKGSILNLTIWKPHIKFSFPSHQLSIFRVN